jgi:hypothetical protein
LSTSLMSLLSLTVEGLNMLGCEVAMVVERGFQIEQIVRKEKGARKKKAVAVV